MGTIARMQAAVSALPDGPVKHDLQRAVTEVIELREAAGSAADALWYCIDALDGSAEPSDKTDHARLIQALGEMAK
jgi:hypothetical protein